MSMGKEVELEERGRVLLPKEVRDSLHLKPGQKLLIEQKGKEIVIRPATNKDRFIAELKGCVRHSRVKPHEIKRIWEKP